MSKSDSQMAYDQALAAKNQSEQARADIQLLIDTIDEFLSSKAARPADVRAVSKIFNHLIQILHRLIISASYFLI